MTDQNPIISLKVDWHIPDDLETQYVTNLVIQHTEHEFIVSFFKILPPLLTGTPEEQLQQAQTMQTIRAECVSRMLISPNRIQEFVDALQTNVDQYSSRFGQPGERHD